MLLQAVATRTDAGGRAGKNLLRRGPYPFPRRVCLALVVGITFVEGAGPRSAITTVAVKTLWQEAGAGRGIRMAGRRDCCSARQQMDRSDTAPRASLPLAPAAAAPPAPKATDKKWPAWARNVPLS